MKTIFIQLSLMVLTMPVWNQTASDKLFEKYANQDGYTTVYISKYMFDLFSKVDEDDKEFNDIKEITNKLTSINPPLISIE